MPLWSVERSESEARTVEMVSKQPVSKLAITRRGHKGDASVLQPTIMFCVPNLWDWMMEALGKKVRSSHSEQRGFLLNNPPLGVSLVQSCWLNRSCRGLLSFEDGLSNHR